MNQEVVAVEQEFNSVDVHNYLESLGNTLKPEHKAQFVSICKAFKLNPFKREIYGIPYGNNFNIIVGYEVYLKRAEHTRQLNGWKCWTSGTGDEMKAVIEIKRHDWDDPFLHEVYMDEYKQNNSPLWKNKPRTMLKKVVMAQGFRLAFPSEFGGMPYTTDELPDKMTKVPPQQAKIVEVEVEDGKVSSVTGKPLPSVDNSKRISLSKMIMEMKGNNRDEAKLYVKKITSFQSGGETVEGKESLGDVSDKQLSVIEARIRSDYKEWTHREKDLPVIDSDTPLNVGDE